MIAAVLVFVTAGPFEVTKLRGLRSRADLPGPFLFAKALKTVRAVRAAALEGCGQDAMVLNRVLLETALAVTWILQTNTRRRGELFLAHQDQRTLVQLDAMSATPGLRRASRRLKKDASAQIQRRCSAKLTPTEFASVKRHWSGLPGGIEAVARKIPGGIKLYQTVYRQASSSAYGSDALTHVFYGDGDDAPTLKILPGDESVSTSLVTAALLLHAIAARMNKRFGLHHDAALEAIGKAIKDWKP